MPHYHPPGVSPTNALKRNGAGDVVLQLKSAYRDGTTHLVLSPLEFMQRLAARVPRPRLHLIRFHGVLAPNAGRRAAIVPGASGKPGEHPEEHARAPARMSWARLLKRVFDMDVEHCPQCGGDLKIIAAIEEPAVMVRILTHLGLPARAPPRAPARPLAAVPGGLIRKAKAVLQRGRLPRSARARPTGKMLPHQPARADAGHEESTRAGEIFIKHRAIDRVLGRRYSRG